VLYKDQHINIRNSSLQVQLNSLDYTPHFFITSSTLLTKLVTVGDRSFATAGPRLWNSLPVDVWSASSLTTFRRRLKTHLFQRSYPDIVL